MKILSASLFGAACAVTAPHVLAASGPAYPSRAVTLIVPNAPGGAIDILGRLLSERLQKSWGQPVVVMYKPGANTVVGTDHVAKSAPDGYTLGLVVTSHVINPTLRKTMPFDTVKDLAGVSMLVTSQIVITATPSLPANDLAGVIAMAKKEPGKMSYASPGSGSSMHLTGELLKSMTGVDMLHIPYKGSGPAYTEVMAGRVPLLIDPLFSSMPYIKSGKLKPIAVTGKTRDPSAPDIPAVAETIPGFNVQSIFGLVAPAATPRDVINKISADVGAILRSADFKVRLAEVGLTSAPSTPEEFDAFVKAEIEKWAPVVKASGATAD
ncbi:tripartite tricarboxylate transporter substrate binding protein [Pigmentiphaga sp.]|uniref:tripartite tricarboxylate transporter substrate binding protein n=1 Tax=Pigmentiphaga sp. TaxID=1977564 RepID=UPI00128D82EF|nr:tripartite tricarboxylate transporter substrate binding protein [Pigmentiphaga sp.]MPS30314.1 tripartite tricarboxylate transporter substrate binding protein [Alcaligenaceae bacterium SAGV5]MPS52434.1 tripartite tricarboxylate transporter substrate binding protein [Alcaligenaceae bacterium SAGV3]MPT58095.1 tripartite tricarboxylate transporter substrate binding protein [Alcaligenaceae bacterium]